MLAPLIALSLAYFSVPVWTAGTSTPISHVTEQAVPTKSLRDVLMEKFNAMNAAERGIFHDDISYVVAPYFPPGQSFAEAAKVIQEQRLGSLRMFKGQMMSPNSAMYVTQFSIMSAMFSDVFIVINLDFDGTTEANMVIRKSSAFIRAPSM